MNKRSKRFTPAEIRDMQALLRIGFSPTHISEHFNVGRTVIYNYRNRFKAEGLPMPKLNHKLKPADISPYLEEIKQKEGSSTQERSSEIPSTEHLQSNSNMSKLNLGEAMKETNKSLTEPPKSNEDLQMMSEPSQDGDGPIRIVVNNITILIKNPKENTIIGIDPETNEVKVSYKRHE